MGEHMKARKLRNGVVPVRSLVEWENLVERSCPELVQGEVHLVAIRCLEAESKGKPVGTWHAAAELTGTLETCKCEVCLQKRKKGRKRRVVKFAKTKPRMSMVI